MMKSLMLRLLSVSVALCVTTFASSKEKDVVEFVKRGLSSNPSLKVYDVKVVDRVEVPQIKGWDAYFVQFKIGIKRGNAEKNLTQSDILFSNGKYVAPDFVSLKTNRSLKQKIVLNIKDSSYYDKEHLLYGKEDAKHKIVIFSDPLCPFCRETVPKYFEIAKKYPDIFALYYYHLPIKQLHPASIPLAKAIIYLKQHGNKAAIEKIYKTEFDYSQKDEEKVLEELDKKLGLKLTKEQINKSEIVNELESDRIKAQKLLVRGTPTIFFDGKHDRTREEYKQYLPKEKK